MAQQPLKLSDLPSETRAKIESLDREQNPWYYQGNNGAAVPRAKARKIKVSSRSVKKQALFLVVGGLAYLSLGIGWLFKSIGNGLYRLGKWLHEVKHGIR